MTRRSPDWWRVLWLTFFFYLLFNTQACDRARPLICNPLILWTCEP